MKLIDASYFYDLIASENLDLLMDSYVLDLTVYELGNALWKNHKKLKRISLDELKSFHQAILRLSLNIMRVDKLDFPEISTIANKSNLTFYDSAYVFYAKKYSLDLLTNDKDMKYAFEMSDF